ncbi:hypothetical protein HHK36_030834 [Tetracentron sinense]|uniref:DUF3456 domain-containing protein n=1 Tax=Tetracentron sinense TaxID=13715 RepID=A0A835D129_TETSI|nr:hypothetical protein HHK36_030834 [Tetracentron sinense]
MEQRKMVESLVWIVTIFAIFISVACIDDRCGACNAVAEELELGLSNEKPRNHLDMRHRLDSKGQRRGKVIDYRVSELRVVELLDGLCEKMQDYTLEKLDSTRREWIKVDDWDNLTTEKQEARAYSKHISSYCGRLLEETEDELAELIKKGSIRMGDVSKFLCQDLSKHCSKTRSLPHSEKLSVSVVVPWTLITQIDSQRLRNSTVEIEAAPVSVIQSKTLRLVIGVYILIVHTRSKRKVQMVLLIDKQPISRQEDSSSTEYSRLENFKLRVKHIPLKKSFILETEAEREEVHDAT